MVPSRLFGTHPDRVFLMAKVCTHGRSASVPMRQLDKSLRRLRTDHLDLWQIHECAYYNDPDRHCAPGGGFDRHFRSFQTRVLPELARQRVAAIGMKSLGGDGRAVRQRAERGADALCATR